MCGSGEESQKALVSGYIESLKHREPQNEESLARGQKLKFFLLKPEKADSLESSISPPKSTFRDRESNVRAHVNIRPTLLTRLLAHAVVLYSIPIVVLPLCL